MSDMAAEMITPVDAETGIPFPLAPRADLPPVPARGERNTQRDADQHHPFHPRAALVGASLSEQALRDCRVQWADYDDHHYRYHPNFVGPPLPVDETERFRTVTFAAAGYIPGTVIGFWQGVPILRPCSEAQRERFWQTGQIRIANSASVRKFLLEYPLRHDFAGINESTIDEFLHTTDQDRKRELGNNLLAIAAYDAAAPLRAHYRQSHELHQLPRHRARTPGRFILGVMTDRWSSKAFNTLATRLAA